MSSKKSTSKREPIKGQQSLLSFIKVSSAKQTTTTNVNVSEKGENAVPVIQNVESRKRKLSVESKAAIESPALKIGKTVSVVVEDIVEQEKENIILNTPDKKSIEPIEEDIIINSDDEGDIKGECEQLIVLNLFSLILGNFDWFDSLGSELE